MKLWSVRGKMRIPKEYVGNMAWEVAELSKEIMRYALEQKMGHVIQIKETEEPRTNERVIVARMVFVLDPHDVDEGADYEAVRHGKWKVISDGYGNGVSTAYICECSKCGDTVWVYKNAERAWNYCPNCGAKMDQNEDVQH